MPLNACAHVRDTDTCAHVRDMDTCARVHDMAELKLVACLCYALLHPTQQAELYSLHHLSLYKLKQNVNLWISVRRVI